jgi:hypothetical protein
MCPCYKSSKDGVHQIQSWIMNALGQALMSFPSTYFIYQCLRFHFDRDGTSDFPCFQKHYLDEPARVRDLTRSTAS